MSGTDMRRAIAQDIIQQLDAELIDPTEGTYLSNLHDQAMNAGFRWGSSLQTYLQMGKRKPCRVCALGAAIISAVRLNNRLEVGATCSIHTWLCDYFSMEQISVIEDLFESFNGRNELRLVAPEPRLRFIWTYVAANPDFEPSELVNAAKESGGMSAWLT